MAKTKTSTTVMPLTFDGKPDKPIALRAYIFDRQGTYMATIGARSARP